MPAKDRILNYLETNYISKCKFAKNVGLSYLTLNRIINGEKCSRNTMHKINRYCGSTIIDKDDVARSSSKAMIAYFKNQNL